MPDAGPPPAEPPPSAPPSAEPPSAAPPPAAAHAVVRAVGRATVAANPATPPPTPPEVRALVGRQGTASLPVVVIAAVGRAPAPSVPRPPAEISHPPTVYRAGVGKLLEYRAGGGTQVDGEPSGSLTGDVLAAGERPRPRAWLRILAISLVVLLVVAVMAAVGLVVAAATSEAVRDFFTGIVGG